MRWSRDLPWGPAFVLGAATIAACESDATVLGTRPTCIDGLRDGNETDVDCGGDQCDPCPPGKGCKTTRDCETAIGAGCVNGTCAFGRTCAEIKARNPAASDGTYSVDPTAGGAAASPFLVRCDMTTDGGGWTRVGFEPAHAAGWLIEGGLVYLGIEVGTADVVARGSAAGLVGVRFQGLYSELAITWGTQVARMTVPAEVFVNSVDVTMPVGKFFTNDSTLGSWVSAAGGAIFCRAARWAAVRPGDTSWAIKPRDSVGSGCGCNDPIWHDRGAFYGGLMRPTICGQYGGAWAGDVDIGGRKGGLTSTADLGLWIR